MPTEGHLNHRFCDSHLEAAQGLVVRVVVVLGKNEKMRNWKAKLFSSPPAALFFQKPDRDLALGLPRRLVDWWTH
jgi:hypothetical protein